MVISPARKRERREGLYNRAFQFLPFFVTLVGTALVCFAVDADERRQDDIG